MKISKKLLSVFLTLALVITLMPAMTLPSQAKSDVSVSTIDQLKSYMESDGQYCAVLQKDISGHADGDYEYWCTVKGTKWIDLNGHKIDISNDNSRRVSTMFYVPSKAALTVYDSTKSGKGNVRFNGYINEDGSYRERGIFDVSGELRLNGVVVEAGRSKDFYSAAYATNVWKQIFGAAVTAESGSCVYVNSSTLYGRGYYRTNDDEITHGRCAGLVAKSTSRVYFNDGAIKAKGGANCFNIYSGATVKVMSGTFTCDKLDAIKCDGKITKGIGLGRVGIPYRCIGRFADVTSSDASDKKALEANNATIGPSGDSTGSFEAESGDLVSENGKNVHQLLASNPKVRLVTNGDFSGASTYFADLNTATYGVDYSKLYTMKIYKNGTLVKSQGPSSRSQTTFSVYNDVVAGFNPERNAVYNLVCEFEEVLNGVHAKGRTVDFYFKVVDTDPPVITSQSPTDIYYGNNGNVYMTVNATGANLSYTWQYKKPGGNWNESSTEKSKTIKAGPLTAADDGTVYRCAVSNNVGSIAWSKEMTLHYDPNSSGNTNPFVDVFESDYYYDAVMWAYYANPQITNGIDETHFGPNITVTRAHCVTFLWRAAGCPEPKSTYNPFGDVPTWQYYYKPVLWAVENGITKGIADDVFAPDDTLTTQHIVTFLYRSMNPGKDGWDGEAAQWACKPYGGKPFGVDIKVNNQTDCPRRDVVVFLYRANAQG